ncbi:hypothetical protein QTP88_024986 [Uroleucon formosanum]
MNEKNIVEYLFEDIPSDSDTFTFYDDSEADETYLPNKDDEVMEVNHLSDDIMDQNDDELVEIFNLDEGNVLLLPSPIKSRHSKRQTHLKNDHTNSNICRPLFPPINQEQYQSTETTELENNIVETNQPENTLIHTYENETSTNSFEFTIPAWSKNNDFSQEPLPDFTCAGGPTSLIDIEAKHTPFSIFQLLFSNDILDLIVYQTNLYAYQIKMKTGKSYIPTDTNEIMTFLGMHILMGIKRDPSYRDYCTRKYLPKLESDKKMVMGDIDWNMSDQYHISIVKWKDKREVALLSNFHNPTDVVEVKRKSKDGTTSMIPCPSTEKVISGGIAYFSFFFDAAIVNSHIIYKKITGEKITLKNFRREISKSLVSKTFVQKRRQKGSGSPSPISIKRASVSPSIRKDQSAHQPERTTRRRCAHCSTKEKEVRTDWKCTICDVPLCISKSIAIELYTVNSIFPKSDESNQDKPNTQNVLTILRNKKLDSLFPNTEIALRLYYTLPISNCSDERSFLALQRVKSYLRSTLSKEKLNSLAILNIENVLLESMSWDECIDQFAKQKSRKASL